MTLQVETTFCVTSEDLVPKSSHMVSSRWHVSASLSRFHYAWAFSSGPSRLKILSHTQYHQVGYLCPLFNLGRPELPWSLSRRGSGLLRLSLLVLEDGA